jgi:hypothetical protein
MEYYNVDTRNYGGQRHHTGQRGGLSNEPDAAIECVEKVEAMVSTSLLHQEDVWNMIMTLFPDDHLYDPKTGLDENLFRISTPIHVLKAIKERLESSMDWSRLAQCRLKGILPENS